MTTAMATSRARLFSDAEPGLFSRSTGNYDSAYLQNGVNSHGHGSKCFCCPYGYHIDLDFVRYCETWQAAASDRIARGNEEKRRRRARQKQCQSMEFLLGLPEEKEKKPALEPSPKPEPPKPPPKPNLDSLKLNQDWQDSLSNFEQALSQSYTGPSTSASCVPFNGCYLSSSDSRSSLNGIIDQHEPLELKQPKPQSAKVEQVETEEEEIEEEEEVDAISKTATAAAASLPSSRLVLRQQHQQHQQQQQQQSEEAASRVENRPCLKSIREQMAAALERMKQLEEQVKEIPLLHVQMSVLREERRLLLRQLASQRRLNSAQQTSKRDASTSCAVVTRDIGVCHQQTKTRETSTNTTPASQCTRSTSTSPTVVSVATTTTATSVPAEVRARLSKGTQCFEASHATDARPTLLSKSVQCYAPSLSTSSTQCESRPKYTSAKAVQCAPETRDTGTYGPKLNLQSEVIPPKPLVIRKNKEVQATESQPWVKLKLSMGITAKPSVSDASTETIDASLSLSTFRRQQVSSGSKSVGVSVGRDLVTSVSRGTETPAPRTRDFGTSPQRKLLVDVSVGASLSTSAGTGSTNYCDECKQISKSLSERSTKAIAERTNAEIGQKSRSTSSTRTRIPVMSEAKNERRCTLIRQDTWTESLDQLGDGSQRLDKYADRLLVGLNSSDKQRTENGNEDNEQRDVKLAAVNDEISPTSEAEKTKELDDALVTSMVLETPKIPVQRPPMEMSREMRAALKVLDDNLRKVSAGGTLPSRVKNASNIVQHEWFKISSTAQADPLSVEFYLDQFEQHSAALLGHVVNLIDSSGNTAMHYAVSHGNFDVVSILLDSKVCDVNRSNNAGYTPVMLAALAQVRNSTHASVVKRLFQMADVNVRARLHGQTALMLAVSHGRKDMSRLLLDAGAAVNLQDEDGSTALMCAAEHGHTDIVRLLLAHPDCDSSVVDVDGSSALKIALEANHADIGVLLYAHQRANRASPMPGQCPSALPIPRPGKRQRTSSGNQQQQHHHHNHHHQTSQQYSALSMSAPASPVAANSRKFHSSSLSLVDSPKYSL